MAAAPVAQLQTQPAAAVATNNNNSNDIETDIALLASCDWFHRLAAAVGTPSDPEEAAAVDTQLLERLQSVRRLLCAPNPPLDQCVELGLPGTCHQVLCHAHSDACLFEAAWIVTNIASGNRMHTQAVLDANCHVPIVALLSHKNTEVAEQAAWTIGNIAGENAATRDFLLQMRCASGATLFEQLIAMYNTIVAAEGDTGRNLWKSKDVVVWVISNLCRGKPQPEQSLLTPCFPFLRRVLREAADSKEALRDALWCVAYISDGADERIQMVLDHGLLGECIERLVLPASVMAGGGIRERKHEYLQNSVLPPEQLAGVFEFLPPTHLKKIAFGCKDWLYDIVCADLSLYSQARCAMIDDKTIESVVVRILGNVVTGNDRQTDAALNLGMLDIVEQVGKKGVASKIAKELCWSLSNITAGTPVQIGKVLERPRLVQFLIDAAALHSDPKVVTEAVWTVANACSGLPSMLPLVQSGLLYALLLAVESNSDAKTLRCAQEGVENAFKDFLQHGEHSENALAAYEATMVKAVSQPSLLRQTSVARCMRKFPDAFASVHQFVWGLFVPSVLFGNRWSDNPQAPSEHPLKQTILDALFEPVFGASDVEERVRAANKDVLDALPLLFYRGPVGQHGRQHRQRGTPGQENAQTSDAEEGDEEGDEEDAWEDEEGDENEEEWEDASSSS